MFVDIKAGLESKGSLFPVRGKIIEQDDDYRNLLLFAFILKWKKCMNNLKHQ